MIASSLGYFRRCIAPLMNSRFARNVAMVGGGIAAGQAISLAFTPFLTRLYGPEAFGAAAAFAAVVSIISPLATLGYANAIVMPDHEEEAGAVARLSILCGLVLAPISLLLVYLVKPWLAAWIGLSRTPWILYLVPLSLLISAFLSVANQSAIRQGLYAAKAMAYVSSTLITNLGKLGGGLLVPSGLLLILLTLAGNALNVVMQLCGVRRQGVLKIRHWFGGRGVRQAARVHCDFFRYRMPQSIINASAVGLPTILLSTLFGSGPAGQYSLAMIILAAPVGLIGQAMGDVLFPKITRSIADKSQHSYALLVKSTSVLFIFSIPFSILTFWGDRIVPIIFGREWTLSGQYIQWLTLWLSSLLVSYASVSTLPALRLQGFLLYLEFFSIVLRIASMYLGFFWFRSDIIAIVLFSLVGMLSNLILIYVAHRRLLQCVRDWGA